MSAYLINHLRIPGGVPSDEGLSYLEQVERTVKPFGGKWLAQGDVQVVEGGWPGSLVLMEFPSMSDAQAWYHSPDYQHILPLRTNHAISDLIFVESLPADFTVAGFANSVRAELAKVSGNGTSS
jgi:uncharacterized protein (DUF1330 family)